MLVAPEHVPYSTKQQREQSWKKLQEIYSGCLLGGRTWYKMRTHWGLLSNLELQTCTLPADFMTLAHRRGKFSKLSRLLLHIRVISTCSFPHRYGRWLVTILFNTMPPKSLATSTHFSFFFGQTDQLLQHDLPTMFSSPLVIGYSRLLPTSGTVPCEWRGCIQKEISEGQMNAQAV